MSVMTNDLSIDLVAYSIEMLYKFAEICELNDNITDAQHL